MLNTKEYINPDKITMVLTIFAMYVLLILLFKFPFQK